MTEHVHTVVVGAGIAGLAAATEAAEYGDVAVFDARSHPGGIIRSERIDGYLCESAAASVTLPASGTSTLVATSGAGTDLVSADPAARRRWIHYPEGLLEVPASPPAAVKSRILNSWEKLGALAEVFEPKLAENREESVADFLTRRFGAQVAARLAQPAVAGIFAGQASRISVDAAFPTLREMDKEGGVIRSGLRRMRHARAAGIPRPALASFRDGMQTLPRYLARGLGEQLQLDTQVGAVEATADGWRVDAGDDVFDCDRLVLACEPESASKLLADTDTALAELLTRVVRAPVTIVHLGIDGDSLGEHQGFGFLAHPKGGLRILGCVFDSVIFPERAPRGSALVRVLMGGRLRPEDAALSEAGSVDLAVQDLAWALGRDVDPVFSRVTHQTAGIPQYELGHLEHVRQVDARAAALGRLALVGWGYRGIGVNSAVADAISAVRSL